MEKYRQTNHKTLESEICKDNNLNEYRLIKKNIKNNKNCVDKGVSMN